MLPDSGQAGAETIEVTPEMIEAGVEELREHAFGEALSTVAKWVYIMMETERRTSIADAGRGREPTARV